MPRLSRSLSPFALLLAMFAIAACSQEEPAPEEAAVTEPEVVEETATEAAEEVVDEAEQEIEVVEESTGDEEEDSGDAPIILAQADTAPATFRFEEGKHYTRLMPTQPTVGGADKVEVAEFFWYGCGHCYEFEPTINTWEQSIPPNVRFVRVPGTWNRALQTHAQLFYTEQVLVRNGAIANPVQFREAVFEDFHRRGNRLLTEDAIMTFFARFGVSESDFENAWNSFEVAKDLRVAADLQRRYGISGVPAMVVNGKYRLGINENVRTYPELMEVVDELVQRESAR